MFVALIGCSGAQSALDPKGPAASEIAGLWWFMFSAATAVFLLVLVLLVRATRRPTQSSEVSRKWMLRGALGLTPLILVSVFVGAERVSRVMHGEHRADLRISVIGWQWWWEIVYLGQGGDSVVTANELHIPVGKRVRLELSTGDVIHSFWVPSLQGKMDLIPGRTNVLWLQADTPGVYRGQCAEFCGVQHAGMALAVVAQPVDSFDVWLSNERRSAMPPGDTAGQRGAAIFSQAGCAYCHKIRGTNSLGRFGPDLTHLAQRRTIGAGILVNTPENLARWIAQTQGIKPGNRMPNVPLEATQLQAVVGYLMQLK